MIIGYCGTNIDEFQKEDWPNTFVAVPVRGEYVRSKRGVWLKVACVTQCMIWEGRGRVFVNGKALGDGTPYIEVELHRNVS